MESVVEALIPITLFLCLLGGFGLNRHYRFRSQQQVQETLRAALARGDALSPETLQAMMPQADPHADRRKAVILLMLALALVGFAIFVDDPEVLGPLFGVACFPLFMSVAYFWLARSSVAPDA